MTQDFSSLAFQRLAEVSQRQAAIVRYQIDICEAGLIFIPLGESANGNLMLTVDQVVFPNQ